VATDYQGALATSIRILEQDMLTTPAAERARTRYVVVFISDGVPEPRCRAGCEDDEAACGDGQDNDGDGLSDGSDPDCAGVGDASLRPDSLYGVCNTDQEVPDDIYVDYDGVCPSYNQPEQIIRRVDELISLQDIYSVGSVTLNSVLLFSPQSVVEGLCPGASTAFGLDREQARATLRAIAQEGGGVFRDANLVEADDEFLDFDFAELRTSQSLRALSAVNLMARRTPNGVEPDQDRDGLSDAEEDALGTDRRSRDTDGDGYGDLVEARGGRAGLEPLAMAGTPCPDASDLDGDRLLDCEEQLLETNPRNPDTDGDGALDAIELILGTDPRRADMEDDPDFDTVPNLDEVRAGSLPTVPDEAIFRGEPISYLVEDLGVRELGGDERRCFEYGVDNLQLVATPTVIDEGLNRILVYASEAPAQLAGARATTTVACFEARYQGESSKVPASGLIDVTEAGWTQTLLALQDAYDGLSGCGFLPAPPREGAIPERGDVESALVRCLPPTLVLSRFVYDLADRRELLREYLRTSGVIRAPQPASSIFVPIETFDPDRDCVRPWEIARAEEMLRRLGEACLCPDDGQDIGDGVEGWISPCCPNAPAEEGAE
jgi:hypothetical protein